ncbi:MAG TPA: hypothetical protein PLA87_22225 [Pseudomonadota bacterium]|nr:hypothetical protein [Pseudomonadota bacterium]
MRMPLARPLLSAHSLATKTWASLAVHARRLTLPALFLVTAVAGCSQPEPEPTIQNLKAQYFAALNLDSDTARGALANFETRNDTVADQIIKKLSDGELTDENERVEAGRALFYSGFLLHVAQHGIEDGYLKGSDFLRPQRYAAGGTDKSELAARLTRSALLLKNAGELLPDDKQIATVQRSVRFNLEALEEKHSPSLLLEILGAARTDLFSTFAALILLRDPELNPMTTAHMQQLLGIVCAPDRFDCNKMGPPKPPPAPLDGSRSLTREIVGPVMIADLLMRRAESLLQTADMDPGQAMAATGEAIGRIKTAQGLLSFGQMSAQDPALVHFPATKYLAPRAERLSELLDAAQARNSGTGSPPLPSADYYKSKGYRSVYQCVACHTAGSKSQGVPQ